MWIAWQLEAAGYEVTVRAWDAVAGSDWTHIVDQIVESDAPLLAVVTAAYATSPEASREWQALRRADPDAARRRIVPVLVDGTPPKGHLAGLTPIVLTGLREQTAIHALLSAIAAQASGRAHPRPIFPGSPDEKSFIRKMGDKPIFPGEHPNP